MGVPDTSVFCLALAAALISTTLAAPDHFDQRQTGQYNVRIQLKELKIVAVAMPDGGEEGDYDEGNYDYEDPVDPMEFHTKSTTAKSTTTTASATTANKTSTPTTAASISSASENVESDSLTTESTIESLELSSTVDALTASSTKNTSEISTIDDTSTMISVNNSLTTFSNSSASINDVVPAVGVEEINTSDSTDSESTTDSEASTPMVTTTTEEATTQRPNNKYDPTKRIRSRVRCRPGYSKDRAGRCRKTRIAVKPVSSVVSH